uniref:C2H2-type domain-containing protein n=1 Tax=Branchiostoma floridae TaxID=7739 RepID=C4A0F0_BRAFL|eukprot:XP_002585725.1 hypothetical protein BRAFLDRAFT_111367 [Branchiostoma floridae]
MEKEAMGKVGEDEKEAAVMTAQQLQCSQCDARFTTTGALKYHLISVHSTSPVQEEPLNERARLRFILKKLGKLQCKNEGCSSSYTTVYGYEYHVRRCGKSENEREVFPCDQCEKTYQSALGLRLHQRTIHAPTPEPDTVVGGMDSPAGESGEGGVTPGKSKRRAAARALLHLQEIVDGEEKVTKSWDRQKERSLKPLYSTPELDIMPQQIQTWTRDIKDVGSVDCPYEDCPKTYTSLIGLKAHLTQCDKRQIKKSAELSCRMLFFSAMCRIVLPGTELSCQVPYCPALPGAELSCQVPYCPAKCRTVLPGAELSCQVPYCPARS